MPPGRRCARWRRDRGPRSRAGASCGGGLLEARDGHLVRAVELGDVNVHTLGQRRRQVLADVVGADRQLAVAAVDEYGELDARRAAVVEERLDRGAHRAAGVEDVVDDDDRHAVDREVEVARVHDRRLGAAPEVVAVEGDVEGAAGHLALEQVAQEAVAPAARGCPASRRAGIAPGRWMPTMASRSGASPAAFFSTISWAMRTSVRRMSSPSRTTFSSANLPPFSASRDRVKGTRRKVAARSGGTAGAQARARSPGSKRSSTGSPFSRNGTSIASKSRGTTARSNTARASSRISLPP